MNLKIFLSVGLENGISLVAGIKARMQPGIMKSDHGIFWQMLLLSALGNGQVASEF